MKKRLKKYLKKYNVSEAEAIDIVDLAENIGFIVGNALLKNDEDGFIISNPDVDVVPGFPSNKIIGVNSNRDYFLKRFIIAHELGHYTLADVGEKLFAHRENKIGKSKEENEFDFFCCLFTYAS